MRFRNPYHFVPAVKGHQRGDLDQKAFYSAPGISHAGYGEGLKSGTIRCRLKLVTAAVVGASRSEGAPSKVEPLFFDGKPGIAGSTLRGMISSLAEAASNSALRVLDQKPYSYRKPMRGALSAIGLVLPKGEGFELVPLTIPTLRETGGKFVLPARFQKYFPVPVLRVYVGHSDDRNKDEQYIRADGFIYKTSSPESGELPEWTADVGRYSWNAPGDFSLYPTANMHIRDGFLLGQKTIDRQPPRKNGGKWAGYMRVLGCWGRDVPKNKTHELFLPCPSFAGNNWPIPEAVVSKFHRLSDERWEESKKGKKITDLALLPYQPLDRPRGGSDGRLRLQPGDLVYFDVDPKTAEICEISFSSIWRDFVETETGGTASAHDFFRAVDAEILPFGEKRKRVTPAEQLFGFATDTKRQDAWNAYCGRLRISDATVDAATVPTEGAFLPAVTLKILSSPKPPSPAMYFKPDNGYRVAKHGLKPGKDDPQGRKFYLHHFVASGPTPWATELKEKSLEQKASVTPLRAGLEFAFTVRFDNLTENDFGLLLYSLVPEDDFHYKLGMGKALGLGSVKLSIEACELVDRSARYTVDGLMDIRSRPLLSWMEKRNDYRATVRAEIRNAIRLLGKIPLAKDAPVQTPNVGIDPDKPPLSNLEEETFRWFVANDGVLPSSGKSHEIRGDQQALSPIGAKDKELPTLERYEWTRRRDALAQRGGR